MRAIVDRFVNSLNDAGVPWCHWKSNEHLRAALDAETDLDLLFPHERREEVEACLEAAGFLRFEAPAHRRYPYIFDFIGLAEESGQLAHAQCHYALTVGEEHLKGYVLPWSEDVLARRISWEEDRRVFLADPADELVLLIVRCALKIRWRDRLRYRRGKPLGGADFGREFGWLVKRVDVERVASRATELLGAAPGARIEEICRDGASIGNMIPFARTMRALARERGWRRMNLPAACLTRWRNELTSAAAGARRSLGFRRLMIPRRRVRPDHGAIIALLGIDGSGKSTLTRRVLEDWEAKIDVELVYFGTGDGPRTLLFRLASIPARVLRTRPRGGGATSGDVAENRWRSVLRAVLAARQKRHYMRWARFLRAQGVIVLCDRLPQSQTTGFNDGPFLTSYQESASLLRRLAARYEARIFDELVRPGPDAAIRLNPSIEVALGRKPNDATREVLQRKLGAFLGLEFPPTTLAPVVAADDALDDILAEVKRHVWQAIAQ